MMEPMRSERPKEGYLEAVKDLCHANDALLIFDEVSSGWRISLGSAQEWLGITPDMSVFAKAMSNGYPMGCVVGSREAMEPADRMFISSSYWSDNIGLAASVTTINELKRRNSTEFFKEFGDKMAAALQDAVDSVGISAQVTGIHTAPTLAFDVPDPAMKKPIDTLFIQENGKSAGVFAPTSFKADDGPHRRGTSPSPPRLPPTPCASSCAPSKGSLTPSSRPRSGESRSAASSDRKPRRGPHVQFKGCATHDIRIEGGG